MESTENLSGHISDVGLLNLLSAKTEADLEGIRSISDVGLILIPEHLGMALARVPMSDVGAIAPVPEGENVSMLAGQATMTGEALAEGNPDTVLFVAGQLMITSVVTSVGFKGIHVAGQVMAPRGSEPALAKAFRNVMGQVLYIPPGARTFTGSQVFTQAFLELLPDATPFVLLGGFRFDNDVQFETLRAKVSEIFLAGSVEVPQALLALVQVLTIECLGEIKVAA